MLLCRTHDSCSLWTSTLLLQYLTHVHEYVFLVPKKPPQISGLFREDATTGQVSWNLLTLDELGGFFDSYKVIYQELTRHSCADTDVESVTEAFSVTTDHAMITGLNPTAEYCVGVAASTTAGVGNYSQSLLPGKTQRTNVIISEKLLLFVAVHTNFLFQVHFHGVHYCPQWVVSLKKCNWYFFGTLIT